MQSQYFIDTKKISIDKFRNILKHKEILPGRVILKDNIDERFDLIEQQGIETLFDLLETLKNKTKIENFAKKTKLSIDYLTIVRREAGSFISSPVKLSEMPFLDIEIIKKLNNLGIKDSKQLFDIAAKSNDRKSLADKYNFAYEKITELVQLCDLVRITGVGAVFSKIIYDSGIFTTEDFLSQTADDLYRKLNKTNAEKQLTKLKFGVSDIQYCLELGEKLPLVFEK